MRQILPVYAELDFAKSKLMVSQLLSTKEHESDRHAILHEFNIADMIKPVAFHSESNSSHQKPTKKSIIVNKQSQAVE